MIARATECAVAMRNANVSMDLVVHRANTRVTPFRRDALVATKMRRTARGIATDATKWISRPRLVRRRSGLSVIQLVQLVSQ